jgi:hypothetical protein
VLAHRGRDLPELRAAQGVNVSALHAALPSRVSAGCGPIHPLPIHHMDVHVGAMNRAIHAELRGVARRVADEVDHFIIRSATYAVLVYDKPELEALLNEVERLTREELKPQRPALIGHVAALLKRLRG